MFCNTLIAIHHSHGEVKPGCSYYIRCSSSNVWLEVLSNIRERGNRKSGDQPPENRLVMLQVNETYPLTMGEWKSRYIKVGGANMASVTSLCLMPSLRKSGFRPNEYFISKREVSARIENQCDLCLMLHSNLQKVSSRKGDSGTCFQIFFKCESFEFVIKKYFQNNINRQP
jgi:hypothetical protein